MTCYARGSDEFDTPRPSKNNTTAGHNGQNGKKFLVHEKHADQMDSAAVRLPAWGTPGGSWRLAQDPTAAPWMWLNWKLAAVCDQECCVSL